MMISNGTAKAMRLRKYILFLRLDFFYVIQRMIVQNVLVNAGNVRVVIIDACENKKRDDRQFVAHEHGFRLLEKLFALLQISLLVRFVHKRVVIFVFPAGAIVAVVALE